MFEVSICSSVSMPKIGWCRLHGRRLHNCIQRSCLISTFNMPPESFLIRLRQRSHVTVTRTNSICRQRRSQKTRGLHPLHRSLPLKIFWPPRSPDVSLRIIALLQRFQQSKKPPAPPKLALEVSTGYQLLLWAERIQRDRLWSSIITHLKKNTCSDLALPHSRLLVAGSRRASSVCRAGSTATTNV